MSWIGALTLIGTLGAIVWGTLRLLAAHDRITGRGDGDDDGGAAS